MRESVIRLTARALIALGACASTGCSLMRSPGAVGAGHVTFEAPTASDWPRRETASLSRFDVAKDFNADGSGPGASSPRLGLRLRVRGEPWSQGWIYHSWVEFQGGASDSTSPVAFDYAAWRPGREPVGPGPGTQAGQASAKSIESLLETADFRQGFTLVPPERGEPVGLVVHAFSLSPSESELAVTEALRQRGWAVLHTRSMTFFPGPLPKREQREPRPPALPSEPAALFKLVDGMLEQFLADYAYAAEAAVGYAQDRTPGLRDKPVVVMGFSFGAILAPTVAARVHPTAAVLVGGGADLMSIASESMIASRLGPVSTLRSMIGRRKFDELSRERLARTRLDPYATAPLLQGRPVLVVHAAWDSIVPARYGDLLWERLGRPERWVFRGGHVLLFWNIGSYADEIADWVERNASGSDGAAPGGASPQ